MRISDWSSDVCSSDLVGRRWDVLGPRSASRRGKRTMSRFASCLGVFLMTAGMAAGCTQAPVTGRNQLILIDEGQANQLGAVAWQQINSEMKVSSDKAARARVQQIGERVAAASGAEGIDWELQLFEEPTPNAFALPGGKIGVTSGMLQVAESDDQDRKSTRLNSSH